MSRRIGFFVDLSNLYYCVGKKFPQRRISYSKLMAYIRDMGTVTKAFAYGADRGEQTNGFIQVLQNIGFKTKFKVPTPYAGGTKQKADWDVGITVDMMRLQGRFDTVILSTGDGDLEEAVIHLVHEGVDVIIVACGINKRLKAAATRFVEIPESMLEDRQNETDKTTV